MSHFIGTWRAIGNGQPQYRIDLDMSHSGGQDTGSVSVWDGDGHVESKFFTGTEADGFKLMDELKRRYKVQTQTKKIAMNKKATVHYYWDNRWNIQDRIDFMKNIDWNKVWDVKGWELDAAEIRDRAKKSWNSLSLQEQQIFQLQDEGRISMKVLSEKDIEKSATVELQYLRDVNAIDEFRNGKNTWHMSIGQAIGEYGKESVDRAIANPGKKVVVE